MAPQKKAPEATHAWLVMLKAGRTIARYVHPTMSAECLGESDFRVLEVLLHKGPMPANAIGPKVDLNPGWVSASEEMQRLQVMLKKIGKRAESLAEEKADFS